MAESRLRPTDFGGQGLMVVEIWRGGRVRFIAPVLKTGVVVRQPGVQIPPSPLNIGGSPDNINISNNGMSGSRRFHNYYIIMCDGRILLPPPAFGWNDK